jgi:ferritin-like metal-binding protein YciE
MQREDLMELYVEQLKDMYSAEKQIVRALPKLIKAAENEDLSDALEQHLQITEQQVERLAEIFGKLGRSERGKKCKGMEGLLEEGSELFEGEFDGAVLDAGIIGAAQKVEHYEIAAYGTLKAFAETLGEAEAARLLDQTLMEEKEADEKLTQIAMGSINSEALDEGDGEGEMSEERDSAGDEEEDVSGTARGRGQRGGARKSSSRRH